VASDAGVVIAASYWGKFKTVVQMLMSIVLIINPAGAVFVVIEYVLIYAAVALTVISLVDYLAKNWNVMQDGAM
jgi:CDP-diacylglycerol--glycerol-3-phosphate 3-phosphatidyltransferase